MSHSEVNELRAAFREGRRRKRIVALAIEVGQALLIIRAVLAFYKAVAG